MLSKLIAFAAGYVLGSKAGRERYEQIVSLAREAARRLDEHGGADRIPGAGPLAAMLSGGRPGGTSRT